MIVRVIDTRYRKKARDIEGEMTSSGFKYKEGGFLGFFGQDKTDISVDASYAINEGSKSVCIVYWDGIKYIQAKMNPNEDFVKDNDKSNPNFVRDIKIGTLAKKSAIVTPPQRLKEISEILAFIVMIVLVVALYYSLQSVKNTYKPLIKALNASVASQNLNSRLEINQTQQLITLINAKLGSSTQNTNINNITSTLPRSP